VSDVRPAVKEQVQSLGGRFIEVPIEENMETSGGYAKEQSEDFLRRQREIVRKHIVEADVVITTALIPGKPAPRLIGADMVKEMRPGSVIVDLAAERGGNCELTEAGRVVVKENVTIDGTLNVAGTVPYHSSEMYARNCLSSVQLFFDKEAKKLNLSFDDDIVDGCVISHGGSAREPGSVTKAKAEAEAKAEAAKIAEAAKGGA
jgi:NAD(P) transhydrogenase subunit alpha